MFWVYVFMFIFWLLVAAIFVVIELHSQLLFGGAAAVAALCAFVTHAITKGNPIWIEVVVFGIVWIVFWVIFAFSFKKVRKFHDKSDGYWNYEGMTLKAYEGNSSDFGKIKIDDKIFRFKSNDSIEKNDKITIIKIKGTTMIVKKEIK